MTHTVLAPGEATELVFVLGQAESLEQVRRLIADYTAAGRAREVLAEVRQRWDHLLSAVQVKMRDLGMDLMLNRWLLYQVLACRVWARSAFYQSSGAYGFRDQLQDVMALVLNVPGTDTCADPTICLPTISRRAMSNIGGIRRPASAYAPASATTLYFLPLAVHHYVTTTGDTRSARRARSRS